MRRDRPYQGERTCYQQVRDYARCLSRPWSWRNVASDLGLPKRNVMKAMQALRNDGEIVRIGPARRGIHLHVTRMPAYGARLEYDWRPDLKRLELMLAGWEPGIYRDAAACAAAAGLAIRTAYRYLELLIYVGVVDYATVPHIDGAYRRTELSLPAVLPAYSEAKGAIQRRKDAATGV